MHSQGKLITSHHAFENKMLSLRDNFFILFEYATQTAKRSKCEKGFSRKASRRLLFLFNLEIGKMPEHICMHI